MFEYGKILKENCQKKVQLEVQGRSGRRVHLIVLKRIFLQLQLRKKIVDLISLHSDPVERKKISEYYPNQNDEIRRGYLLKGLVNPVAMIFPRK